MLFKHIFVSNIYDITINCATNWKQDWLIKNQNEQSILFYIFFHISMGFPSSISFKLCIHFDFDYFIFDNTEIYVFTKIVKKNSILYRT